MRPGQLAVGPDMDGRSEFLLAFSHQYDPETMRHSLPMTVSLLLS